MTTSVRRTAAALLACLLTAMGALADAPRPFELGVYVPRLPFADGVTRNAYARDLAAVLADATGLPVRGQAFSSRSDVVKWMEAGRLDLLFVDASFLTSGSGTTLLGNATGPSGPSPRLVLYGAGQPDAAAGALVAPTVERLRALRLAVPGATPVELRLLSNVGFESVLRVSESFREIVDAPDLAEAVRRVQLGQADAVIGWEGTVPVLSPIIDLARFPLPVLVGLKSLPEDARTSFATALRGDGVVLPPLGPITRLQALGADLQGPIEEAASRTEGRAPAPRPIWSPTPSWPERSDAGSAWESSRLGTVGRDVAPRRAPRLEVPRDRFWVPELPPAD